MKKSKIKAMLCGALAFTFCMCGGIAGACGKAKDGGEETPPEIEKPVTEKDDVNTAYLKFKREFKIMVLADIRVRFVFGYVRFGNVERVSVGSARAAVLSRPKKVEHAHLSCFAERRYGRNGTPQRVRSA